MNWPRVRAEFEALLALDGQAQQARVSALAATDEWLAGQLRELLEHDRDAASFLERAPAAAPVLPPPLARGRRLGRFELLRPLGTGGMGAVWLARQRDPDREVALKLIAGRTHSPSARWRFDHEVQVLASLNHPGIATFHEAGIEAIDGTEVAWFAMELVACAVDLLTSADDRELSRDARIDLFVELCDAVDYGHRRGVLHRDLKPGNVLVDRDGRLKLIDFGIARALEPEHAGERTQTGEIVGTLQYMAPEQVRGDVGEIGTASDVYGLGVLLYRLLCGRSPFDLDNVPFSRLATVVLEQAPLPPQTARRDLPRELGWILLRALAKEPSRRYPTAAALADDIARFRANLPVRAAAPGIAYRARKFVRRHRLALGVATMLVVGSAVGVTGLLHGLEQAQTGEARARRGAVLSREVARVTAAMFDAIDDTVASKGMGVHELLDASAPRDQIRAEPAVEMAVRELRGMVYSRLGRVPQARAELERARQLRLELSADPDPVVFGSDPAGSAVQLDATLGRARVHDGERESGWQLVRDALAATEHRTDTVRAAVLWQLCWLLADANENVELENRAIELGDIARSIGSQRMAIGADIWLAMARSGLGRHGEARVASERAVAAARAQQPPRPPEVCRALSAHLTALQGAGNLDAVEALYPDFLAATREVFGAGHGNMLTALNNQVDLLLKRGRRAAAVDAMREVVRLYDERGKPVDADHLAAINNLGMALTKVGQLVEAEPLLARAARLSATLFDPADPNGPFLRINHAACLTGLHRWSEAEPILLAEYERAAAMLPPEHPALAGVRRTIAEGYERNGDPEKAASWRARK